MEIVLTRGMVAVIDDTDTGLVEGRHWTAMSYPTKSGLKWYAKATDPGKITVLMHRVLLGAAKGQLVDHKDGNGLNNRRSNIRLCTQSGNMANTRSRRSQFRGVDEPDDEFGFIARIANGRIGKFSSAVAAAKAYDAEARKRYGDFARLNFPNEGELSAFEPETAALTLADSTKAKASRKLLPDGVMDVYRRFHNGESPTQIARSHGIDRRLVYAIVKGEMWNHVTGVPKAV